MTIVAPSATSSAAGRAIARLASCMFAGAQRVLRFDAAQRDSAAVLAP